MEDGTLTGIELYNALNVKKSSPSPVPGLKEKIHFGLSAFAYSCVFLMENPWNESNLLKYWDEYDIYDSWIKAGVYGLAAIKSKLQTYESLDTIPDYYQNTTTRLRYLDLKGFLAFLNKHSKTAVTYVQEPTEKQREIVDPVTKEKRMENVPDNRQKMKFDFKLEVKAGKAINVKIIYANGRERQISTIYIGLALVYSLAINGAYVNAGHHMTSINSILKYVTKFGLTKKDAWFQDGGINLQKIVKKEERSNAEKYRSFASVGISRKFHPHLRLVNAPKEVKANLRASTGVLTDVIDYIIHQESDKSIKGEDERIKNALKKKTPWWKDSTIDDVLEYMVTNKDSTSRGTVMSLFSACVSMNMPNIRYILCLPFRYWLFCDTVENIPDFGAQGFYKCYKRLVDASVNQKVYTGGSTKPDEALYAMLLGMMDMHFADQNLMSKIFEGVNPKTRADMSNFEKGKRCAVKLPNLLRWSKVYSGQKGSGGEEQAVVVQTLAGQVKYTGSDFITEEPEEAIVYNNIIGKQMIVQRLQEELRRNYHRLNDKSVTYGTQKWYSVANLNLSNEDLQKTEGEILSSSSVMPYYSNKRMEEGGASIEARPKKLRKK